MSGRRFPVPYNTRHPSFPGCLVAQITAYSVFSLGQGTEVPPIALSCSVGQLLFQQERQMKNYIADSIIGMGQGNRPPVPYSPHFGLDFLQLFCPTPSHFSCLNNCLGNLSLYFLILDANSETFFHLELSAIISSNVLPTILHLLRDRSKWNTALIFTKSFV